MRIRKLALGLAIVGMALALPCLAQGPPGGAQSGVLLKADGFVAEVNTSKTGKITKEEWAAAGLPDIFDQLDTDKSGYLTKERLEATKFPAAMDPNKDGILTVAKFLAFSKIIHGGASGGGAPGGSAPSGGAPGGPPSN